MPIPNAILTLEDWGLFLETAELISEKAKKLSGANYDLGRWQEKLNETEFALVLLAHFLGTVENCGSFVDEAYSWSDERARLKAAFELVGAKITAEVFDEAVIVGNMFSDGSRVLSDAEERMRPRMAELEEIAMNDLAYAKLASFIKTHKDRILSEDIGEPPNTFARSSP